MSKGRKATEEVFLEGKLLYDIWMLMLNVYEVCTIQFFIEIMSIFLKLKVLIKLSPGDQYNKLLTAIA